MATTSDDLTLGVPNEDLAGLSNPGGVTVMFASSTGLRARSTQKLVKARSVLAASDAGDKFGWALAAADFFDTTPPDDPDSWWPDGVADLAIIIPSAGAGRLDLPSRPAISDSTSRRPTDPA